MSANDDVDQPALVLRCFTGIRRLIGFGSQCYNGISRNIVLRRHAVSMSRAALLYYVWCTMEHAKELQEME